MATRQATGKSASGKSAGGKSAGGKSAGSRPAGGRPAKGAGAGKPAAAGRSSARSAPKKAGRSAEEAAGSVLRSLDAAFGRPARAVGRAAAAAVRWSGGGFAFTTLVLSLLGLADSAFLTYQHVTQATSFAGCSANGAENCVLVTTSQYSHVFGLPVSELGLAFYVFMVAVNSRWGWRAPWRTVHWARLASVVVGMIFVLYLVWAEIVPLGHYCLYCTGVHILTFLLFAMLVSRAVLSGVRGVESTD